VDGAGGIYVTGITVSTNFPTVHSVQPDNRGGLYEAFLTKVPFAPDSIPPMLAFAGTRGEPETLYVTFTEPIVESTATNATSYLLDHGAVVRAVSMAEDSKTVRLVTSPLAAGVEYTLTVSDVQDRAATPNTLAPNSSIPVSTSELVRGRFTRKVFTGIPGSILKHLRNHPKFPNHPDIVEYTSAVESAVDALDDYGVQLTGFIQPPVTGDYVFYLCSEGEGALFLGPDDRPEHQRQIAFEPVGNGSRQWIEGKNQPSRGDPPSNISAAVHLVGGRLYPLEAVMKAGAGGDNLAVAWRLSGASPPVNEASPITGLYLWSRPAVGPASIVIAPSDQSVAELGPAAFTVLAEGTPPVQFQWFRDGEAIPGATNDTWTILSARLGESGAALSVVVSNALGSVTSRAARLVVQPDLTAPVLVSARCMTLEQVEVTFSEPLLEATATNQANYAIRFGEAALAVTRARLAADPTRVELTTGRHVEGGSYTLTVNLLRDASANANEIVPNSQASYTPDFPEESLGPFPSWADLKRDFGAVGDGLADDTLAWQRALEAIGDTPGQTEHPHVLYVPAGTYRITRTLELKHRISVSVQGEHPDTTILKWDGAPEGILFHWNGLAYSRIGRLTLDGAGRALSTMDHKYDQAGPFGPTGCEYDDMVFRDTRYGIRAGVGALDSEVAVLRCRFLRCSEAGISMESYNALDWWVWHSLFEDCLVGVTNGRGSGHCHVYESLFKRSRFADITIGNCSGFFSFRRNTSIESKAFLGTGYIGCAGNITVQGNTIIDPDDATPVIMANLGPLFLFDNVIQSRRGLRSGPVVALYYDTASVVSVGNTFTVSNAVQVLGGARMTSLDDRVVDRDNLRLTVPELPPTPPNLARPVIEVPVGASATRIQEAIDQAARFRGQRPIVHLPACWYQIDRTLVIPPGSDVQLVGDGSFYSSMLDWKGLDAGPVLRIDGPSHATLRELSVTGGNQATGIVVDDCDQPGARVFLHGLMLLGAKDHNLLVDRLDHACVDLRALGDGGTKGVSLSVVGGPGLAAGVPSAGRVAVFGGSSALNALSYEVRNGGRLLVQDIWYEGPDPGFMRCMDSGVFTLHGALIASDLRHPSEPGRIVPEIQVAGFRGPLTFLGTLFASPSARVILESAGDELEMLLIGVNTQGTEEGAFLNRATNGRAVSLYGYANPPAGTFPVPDQGSVDASFLRRALAQTREVLPRPPARLAEEITDLRFQRVTVHQAVNGVHLVRLNEAPRLAPVGDRSVNELEWLTVNCVATDADLPHQSLTFALGTDAPPGARIDPVNGVLTWRPTEAQGPGNYLFTVRVTDNGYPPRYDERSFSVVVNEVNTPPSLTSLPAALPTDFGETVNGFQDDFDGSVLTPGWAVFGYTGSFTLADGMLRLVSEGGEGLGLLAYQGAAYDGNVQEVLARMRVTRVGPSLAAGPGLAIDQGTGGLNFVFRADGDRSRIMVFLDEYRAWGPELQLDWQTNMWFWVRLRFEPDTRPGQADAFARIWPADGVAPEPAGWLSWDCVPFLPARTGLAGIRLDNTAGGIDVDYVLIKAAGLPPITVSPKVATRISLPPIEDKVVDAGTRLEFPLAAIDGDLPPQRLTFGLDPTAPGGAAIDPASGLFSWTPGDAQAPGTYPVTVRVTDDGVPPLTATNVFTVVVNRVEREPPRLREASVSPDGRSFTFSWEARAGKRYRVESKERLDDPVWVRFPAAPTMVGTTASITDAVGLDRQRYYRVVEEP